jgi:hypothetical protein
MAGEKRDIAETNETEYHLAYHGARAKFAEDDQLGMLILGKRHHPQQDFPYWCVNRSGNMACSELKSGPDINHRGRLLSSNFFTSS